VPIVAAVAAGAGLVAALGGSEAGPGLVFTLALVVVLIGVLLMTRSLERYRKTAEARVALEAEARTMRILDRSNDAYISMSVDGIVTAWNTPAETMFGWRRMEAVGRELAELIIPLDNRDRHREGLKRYLATGEGPLLGRRAEMIAQHRDGARLPVEVSIVAVDEPNGERSFHGFVRDITERKLLETQQAEMLQAAKESARIDSLTSLPNRRGWDEELGRELARARRERTPFCIALLDLDHFKVFNDNNGHQAGDMLLRRAASAWRLALRQSDFVARYGGEEFAVLLPVCELDEAMEVIERLREATPEGQTVSAGVAQWNGYEAENAIIDRADLALYNAKRDGRDRTTAAA
jgi:diguanylate cyclase (GGDEF)-like protein/PAS domain S-box-containing protein